MASNLNLGLIFILRSSTSPRRKNKAQKEMYSKRKISFKKNKYEKTKISKEKNTIPPSL